MKHHARHVAAVVTATMALILALAAPSSAAPTDPATVSVGNRPVRVASDWKDPAAVEAFLLRVEAAQGNRSLAFLQAPGVTPEIKAAVYATITRRAAPDVTETSGVYGPEESRAIVKSMLGTSRKALGVHLLSWTCGWGEKQVNYQPGAIRYYWFKLHTNFCWDGTNVQASPTQQVSGDGSWGWSYQGCSSCTLQGWPAPTQYRSYAQGEMSLGGGPADYTRRPWIEHIVKGIGWVDTSWHD
jgi:hypothetical protein